MSPSFVLGVAGLLILVTGAALPAKPVRRAAQSLKNWCFTVGGFCMFVLSIADWLHGASVFFVFVQCVAMLSTLCMMLDVPDRFSTPVTIAIVAGLVMWSLYLSQHIDTIIFILGLSGIALGFEWKLGTRKREIALMIGSSMIVLFSYINSSWIFFWLNVFFAAFSLWQVVKISRIHLAAEHRVRT